MLDSASFSGDALLSKAILDALGKIVVEEARADNYHVFTKLGDGTVLVLIKSPDLKNFAMPARVELLHAVESILASQPQTKGKQWYVGVKGRIAFGAIRVPPDQIKTGSVLEQFDRCFGELEILPSLGDETQQHATKRAARYLWGWRNNSVANYLLKTICGRRADGATSCYATGRNSMGREIPIIGKVTETICAIAPRRVVAALSARMPGSAAARKTQSNLLTSTGRAVL